MSNIGDRIVEGKAGQVRRDALQTLGIIRNDLRRKAQEEKIEGRLRGREEKGD